MHPPVGLRRLFLALLMAKSTVCLTGEQSSNVPKSVFQIVRPSADHSSLEVVEEGVRRLREYNEPISIVGVVGGFHTGKSFLCNVLNGTTSGFELGPTHEATTMGLWLGETDITSAVDGSRVFLLDTEGFSAAGVAEAYDAQVFSVALLLSSHLVYNSVKLITAAEVEYLETLVRRAHLWTLSDWVAIDDNETVTNSDNSVERTKCGEKNAIPSEVSALPFAGRAVMGAAVSFPPLTWVVEDFFQDLGTTTPTEWLMSFIDEKAAAAAARRTTEATTNNPADSEKAGSKSGSSLSKLRHGSVARRGVRPLVDGNYTISRLFSGGSKAKGKTGTKDAGESRVKVQTLFLPASSRLALRNLSTVPYNQLDAEFREQVSDLRREILATTAAKRADTSAIVKCGTNSRSSLTSHTSALTGQGIAALLHLLLASVSAGHFPSMPSLWSSWESQLLSQARTAALDRHASMSEEALRGVVDVNVPEAKTVSDMSSPASTSTNAFVSTPLTRTRRYPYPPDEFKARLMSARLMAESLFKESLFGLEQLWQGPLVDLRRELIQRERKDTQLNDAAVDRILNDAAEEAAADAERSISNLSLPIPQGFLERKAKEHIATSSAALSLKITRYATSAATGHNRAMRRLTNACNAAVASARLASAAKEANILSTAVDASLRRYDLEITAATIRQSTMLSAAAVEAGSGVLPMSSKVIKSLDMGARATAIAAFDDSVVGKEGDTDSMNYGGGSRSDTVKDEGMDRKWLLRTPAGIVHRSQVEKGLEKRGSEWIHRNEAAAAERCAVARKLAIAEVEAETDRLVLPDLAASLRAKMDDIIHRNTARFASQASAIADTSAYSQALAELTKTFNDHASITMDQNARRWHQALSLVSAAALKRLRLNFTCSMAILFAGGGSSTRNDTQHSNFSASPADVGNITIVGVWRDAAFICFRDALPMVFDWHATKVWISEFESRRRGELAKKKPQALMLNMTETTVHEVARVFVATDIAAHREGVLRRFYGILALVAAWIAGTAWTYWFSRATRRCSETDRPTTSPLDSSTGTNLTIAENLAVDTSKPAPWIKIECEGEEDEETDGEEVDVSIKGGGALATEPEPFIFPTINAESHVHPCSGLSEVNPLLWAAQQPLPSEPSEVTNADEYSSDDYANMDSPSAPPLPPFSTISSDALLPESPLKFTVADMNDEIYRVRAGNAAAEERMCVFHSHPDVRHLVSAAETYLMRPNQEDARTLAEWHERVMSYVRLRTDNDDQKWKETPYVAGVLRRYADRI